MGAKVLSQHLYGAAIWITRIDSFVSNTSKVSVRKINGVPIALASVVLQLELGLG